MSAQATHRNGCPGDVSKTNAAQPSVTSNVLAENPTGVALNGEWVDSSIPSVSIVNFDSMSSTNFEEFVLERHCK